MNGGIMLWPPTASEHAHEVDLLIAAFGTMVWILTLPVFVLMGFFIWRYRRGRAANRQHSRDRSIWLESSWALIPFVLTLVFYVWATSLYLRLQQAPADALTINVVAKQWMWKFQHPEGAREINVLHVPVGMPIRLVMTSQDVIHSLYLPALRIKQDVVPGRYTSEWFVADTVGTFPLRCAEFCGADHSVMGGKLVVMPAAAFTRWIAARSENGGLTSAQRGQALFETSGCAACHARIGGHVAPRLPGIFGKRVPLADGGEALVDEQYLRDALLLPNKQVAAGFRPIMPSYANTFDAEEIDDLVTFLKSNHEGLDR
jgi:cytochrome c oxidase subunit 2